MSCENTLPDDIGEEALAEAIEYHRGEIARLEGEGAIGKMPWHWEVKTLDGLLSVQENRQVEAVGSE